MLEYSWEIRGNAITKGDTFLRKSAKVEHQPKEIQTVDGSHISSPITLSSILIVHTLPKLKIECTL